jgi:peroxin-5
VKQQANEREDKAIQALRRAVELDPSLLAAWLELAVSYTNEGDRSHAYDAIENWIDRKDIYTDAVRSWKESKAGPSLKADRAQDLIGCLIAMARSMPGGAVDADVQIALGVLLNTSEVRESPSEMTASLTRVQEYDKAKDCFEAALGVRPDGYLLYNRIGATTANGGHPDKAIYYYRRALELNPTYIRARYEVVGSFCILAQALLKVQSGYLVYDTAPLRGSG